MKNRLKFHVKSHCLQAFGLHGHGAEEEAHDHEEGEDQTYIWRGVVIIVGTYFFFIFETILHTWNPHSHGVSVCLISLNYWVQVACYVSF